MIRKTLTILSLVGLVLSLGLSGVSLAFSFGYRFRSCGIGFEHSALVFGYFDSAPLGGIGGYCLSGRTSPTLLPFFLSISKPDWALVVPLWIPILICGLILWFLHNPASRRRKRKKLGLCIACAYDLRGSSERCPECGVDFEASA